MQTIHDTQLLHPIPDDIRTTLSSITPFSDYHTSEICFFDIETTGLSADVSSVYLVGCAYICPDGLTLKQWFADDYVSEKEILLTFLDFIHNFKLLVHFNGTTFDIPYLKKKCAYYEIECPELSMSQFDLYYHLRSYKKFLPLANLRQKSVERFLNIWRKDQFDGGQLIQVYADYMKLKYFRSPDKERNLQLLLLHNREDILGLVRICPILDSLRLFQESPTTVSVKKTAKEIEITGTLSKSGSFPIFYEKDRIHLQTSHQGFMITLPIIIGNLKYFYPNYKDYFFLPAEDVVIHKSVAAYVEPSYRKKVTKENCFVVKEGCFIPAYYNQGLPEFRESYKNKVHYIELTQNLLEDTHFWVPYALHILQSL